MRHRRAWVIAGIGLGLIVVVGGIVIISFRDTATPVSAGQVTEGFGDLVVGTEPGDPGLYRYATAGYETTDALGGSRHSYPPETFLVLQPGGCGTVIRWHVLDERWSETEHCGVEIPVRWTAYNRWFGVEETGVFVCEASPPGLPPAGGTWSARCGSEDTMREAAWEVVGTETLDVAGTTVPTVHIRKTTSSSGKTEGTSVTDTWYLEGTLLPVKEIGDNRSVTSSPIGPVTYREEYQVELTSLVPTAP
jgi:hypothetical protein